MVGRRMGSNLFVLSNVVVLCCRRGHEWPQVLLLFLPHVQKSGTDGSEQPFMKAGSIVVGAEIVALEWEMREGVRPIDEDLDSQRSRNIDDAAHGHYLAGEVGDVR